MAIGDVTQKKLLQKALTTTATGSAVTGATSKTTTITSITLLNTGTTARTISVYLYGTAVNNEIARIPLVAGGSEILTGLDWILLPTETLSLKQDAGTDVNVAVMGLEEVTV